MLPLIPVNPIMFPGSTLNIVVLTAFGACQMHSLQYWKRSYYFVTAIRSLTLSRELKFPNSKNFVPVSIDCENLQQHVLVFLTTSVLTEEVCPIHAGWTSNPVNIIFLRVIEGASHLTIASFTENCTIYADTSTISTELLPKTSPEGKPYYCIAFDVILLFGLTELKAQISWIENVRVCILRL